MVASITLTVQGEARGAVGPLEGCADPRIWLWFEAERSVGREYPLGGARCPSPTPNFPWNQSPWTSSPRSLLCIILI
jgi:hypothetical protein